MLDKRQFLRKMTKIRTYSELRKFDTFEERYKYLMLRGGVGRITFGFDRWVNQRFYRSQEWKNIRSQIIVRDNGCDLGIDGREIHVNLLVHHMNPISMKDISDNIEWVMNPEYLITTSLMTHNAIHYGDEKFLSRGFITRKPGDTKLW